MTLVYVWICFLCVCVGVVPAVWLGAGVGAEQLGKALLGREETGVLCHSSTHCGDQRVIKTNGSQFTSRCYFQLLNGGKEGQTCEQRDDLFPVGDTEAQRLNASVVFQPVAQGFECLSRELKT